MEVKIGSSRLIKPLYEDQNRPLCTTKCTPLSFFDLVTFDQHIAITCMYRPPIPPNSTLELGLRRALSEYRECAGRFGVDTEGNRVILLNDEGVRFVEASVDRALDHIMPLTSLLCLHPNLEGVVELVQVQLTRFSCGSMALGFSFHHFVADGLAISNFLVAWGHACRGLQIEPSPMSRRIFPPRNPPMFEFNHRGVEYIVRDVKQIHPSMHEEDIVWYEVCFTTAFLSALKAKASSRNANGKPYSTFESLLAHLWRAMTKVRGLDEEMHTQVRISVDGRTRLNPSVPKEYFGNLVLWAFAKAKVSNLLHEPLPYAAKILHDAVVGVNDSYFKSFIDFSNHKVIEEGLIPNADAEQMVLWPNVEVHSWVRFPFYEIDFGCGGPQAITPSFAPIEGMIILLPSMVPDGSMQVCVSLFRKNLEAFQLICYS